MVILPGFRRKTLICSCSFRSFFGPLTGDTSHGMSGCLVFPGIWAENGRGVGMATARERSEFFLVDRESTTHVVHYFSRYFLRCCGTLRMFSVFCFVFTPGAYAHADPYASAFSIFRYYFVDICTLCKSPISMMHASDNWYLYRFAGSIYLHIGYMLYIYIGLWGCIIGPPSQKSTLFRLRLAVGQEAYHLCHVSKLGSITKSFQVSKNGDAATLWGYFGG